MPERFSMGRSSFFGSLLLLAASTGCTPEHQEVVKDKDPGPGGSKSADEQAPNESTSGDDGGGAPGEINHSQTTPPEGEKLRPEPETKPEPRCGDGTLDEREACDPGEEPSTRIGECNSSCEVNSCTGGKARPCSEAGKLGNCADGHQLCADGTWGACSIQPTDGDSCAEAGDDSDCNGTPNGACACLEGDTSTCADEYGLQGQCGDYTLTCASSGEWPSSKEGCAAQSGDSCAAAGDCLGGVWNDASTLFDSACFQ